MGIYRLLLASLVVLGHCAVRIFDCHPGVVAVISFFLLSGFVMRKLVTKYYADPRRVTSFYLDRAARLFPQYLFYLAVTSVAVWQFNIQEPYVVNVTLLKTVMNATILPLGLSTPLGLDGATLLPQAWTLAVEMCFYAIIPWILINRHWSLRATLMIASFVVFLFAYAGRINADLFGYRLLPGTLFIFLIGTALAGRDVPHERALWIVPWLAALALFAHLFTQPTRGFNKEVLAGIVVGVPIVTLLRHVPFSAMDEWAGNMSYGVFLNHVLILMLLQRALGAPYALGGDLSPVQIVLVLTLSLTAAAVSYRYVERPALLLRRRLRDSMLTRRHPLIPQRSL